MTPADQDRWRRVQAIFFDAIESENRAERRIIAEAECGGDPWLLREVECLLALREESRLTLDEPAAALPPPFADQPRFAPGAVLAGRYRIVRLLSRGGTADVYEAIDGDRGAPVAIKSFRPIPGNEARIEAYFQRELAVSRAVQHRNVALIYALEHHAGDCFLVMELLRGESLAACLESRGPLTPEELLPIAIQICDGLDAAHRAGIVHRDLKPRNIFVAAGRAVLIDFGLGTVPGEPDISGDGWAGTAAYMAPERIAHGETGRSSDIYALGVVLHEALTGLAPRGAGTHSRRELPGVWREAVERCTDPRPEARFSTAGEIRSLLLSGVPTWAFRIRRHRRPIAAALAAIGIAATVWTGTRLATSHSPSPSVAALYSGAQTALARGAPLRAAMALEQAVREDPEFVNAQSLLAAAYLRLDQRNKAHEAVLRATEVAERRWTLLSRKEGQWLSASRAATMRDFARAADLYGKLAASSRGAERTYAVSEHANMLHRSGRSSEALGLVESLLREQPGDASARVQHAILLAHARRTDEARAELRRAETAFMRDKDPEGLSDTLLARASLRIQERASDQADLERALEASAQSGNRYHSLAAKVRLAAVFLGWRDYEQALSLSQDATRQALRESMTEAAAQALGESGYALMFLRRYPEAASTLREAVAMAERAGNAETLARNRLRLGEALLGVRRFDDAVAALEPSVAWYEKHGLESDLPRVLIKWGTALGVTRRIADTEAAFVRARDIAERLGDDEFRALALQRLSGFHGPRDLRKAAAAWDEALALTRKIPLVGSFFLAADNRLSLGEFDKAEALLREGRELSLKIPPGGDRTHHQKYERLLRARAARYRGECAAGLALVAGVPPSAHRHESDEHRLRACVPGASVSSLRDTMAWFENEIARAGADPRIAQLTAGAGDAALRLRDWKKAREHAMFGIAKSREYRLRVLEMENAMVLRAAERRMGNVHEADRLAATCLEASRAAGFDPPERFGGRQDLQWLWRAGS